LLLFGLGLLDLAAALGAKGVAPAESLAALGAGQLQASLEVQYANCGIVKVYVFNRHGQRFGNTTAKVKKKAN